MDLVKTFQKAMIDKGITGNPELSVLSGVSYDITLRLMKGSRLVKLMDVVATADVLGIELKFISKGES